MPKIILVLVIGVIVLALSKNVRRFVFHVHVRRFLLIFSTLTFIALCIIGGYFAWKYWWPLFMAKPTVEWHDVTLEQEQNPDTPGTGGPATPVIIQTR